MEGSVRPDRGGYWGKCKGRKGFGIRRGLGCAGLGNTSVKKLLSDHKHLFCFVLNLVFIFRCMEPEGLCRCPSRGTRRLFLVNLFPASDQLAQS